MIPSLLPQCSDLLAPFLKLDTTSNAVWNISVLLGFLMYPFWGQVVRAQDDTLALMANMEVILSVTSNVIPCCLLSHLKFKPERYLEYVYGLLT